MTATTVRHPPRSHNPVPQHPTQSPRAGRHRPTSPPAPIPPLRRTPFTPTGSLDARRRRPLCPFRPAPLQLSHSVHPPCSRRLLGDGGAATGRRGKPDVGNRRARALRPQRGVVRTSAPVPEPTTYTACPDGGTPAFRAELALDAYLTGMLDRHNVRSPSHNGHIS